MGDINGRVLGIDLAIGLSGYAIMDKAETPKLIKTGIFKTPQRRKYENRGSWNRRRCDFMRKQIESLITSYSPGFVAYEYPDKPRSIWTAGGRGRSNKGVEFRAMQGLGLAEGILTAVCPPSLPLIAISTSEAKKFIAGRESASKIVVRDWLQMHLKIHFPDDITYDESDAASIAYACIARFI